MIEICIWLPRNRQPAARNFNLGIKGALSLYKKPEGVLASLEFQN